VHLTHTHYIHSHKFSPYLQVTRIDTSEVSCPSVLLAVHTYVPESRRSTDLRVTFSLFAMTVAAGCSCFPCKQMMTTISLCFSDKTALYVITNKSVQPAIRDSCLQQKQSVVDSLRVSEV